MFILLWKRDVEVLVTLAKSPLLDICVGCICVSEGGVVVVGGLVGDKIGFFFILV